MKKYPKVPRYNHGLIEDEFSHIFDDEVIVLEKLDGCNFRFMLYEDEYSDLYTDEVREIAEDNQIVYGSRNVVKGTEKTPPKTKNDKIDYRFMRGYEELDSIDKSKISDFHNSYGCPLVFYCECMTFHHKDNYLDKYNLIGFEVYKQEKPESGYHGNPYKESFEGFLPVDEAFKLLEDIGITTTEIVDRKESINPEEYNIPETAFGKGESEGVVIRSDKNNRRVKKVHEKYSELNNFYFGPSKAESNEEELLMKYCTKGRMSKIMKKICVENNRGISMDIIPELADRVYEDIWEEEWYNIKEYNKSFNPSKLNDLVTQRCAGFTERVIKFSDDVGLKPIKVIENHY
jgi:hypothetical protein